MMHLPIYTQYSGAKLRVLCAAMDSSLYKTIISGDIHLLKKMIDSSPDGLLLQMTPLKNTTLHIAVKYNRLSCVEEICKRCPSSLLLQANLKGDTALHIAARLGLPDIASFLIYQTKIHHKDIDNGGESAFDTSLTAVQNLVRMKNEEEDTALHEAVRNDWFEVVKLLTVADPSSEYLANNAGETLLYLAAENGLFPHVVRIMQKCRSSVHDHGPHGRTALHIAVISNNSSSDVITKFLMENKPRRVEERDNYGRTPLHYTAYYGYIEKVVQLLKPNPSVASMSDKDGKTALHVTASSSTCEDRIKVIEELTQCCPECWELPDIKGRNFLHAAAGSGIHDVINYVLDLDERMILVEDLINEADKNGNTPLHLACMFKNFPVLEILSRNDRVKKNATNKESLTALDLLHDNLVNDDDNVLLLDAYNNLTKAGAVRSYRKQTIKEESDKREERIKEELDVRNRRRKNLEEIEKERQTRLLVATLIATVTFAAGFTLPGGYFQDGPHKGMAILTRRAAFIVFVVSNTIAMLLSTFTIFIHLWFRKDYSTTKDDKLTLLCVSMEYWCTFGAIIAMVVAFMTGAYAVLFHPHRLAISICRLGCSFFFLVMTLFYETYKLRGIVLFGYMYSPGRKRVKCIIL